MYGVFYIRSVSVGLDSQILYLFIYITGYSNVRKISETMDFRTFVGPLLYIIPASPKGPKSILREEDTASCNSFVSHSNTQSNFYVLNQHG